MTRTAGAVLLVLLLAACGGGTPTAEEGGTATAEEGGTATAEEGATASAGATAGAAGSDGGAAQVEVVATTSILGDIAATVVGDAGTVEVLLPIGADPHSFSPSAAQASALREADLVVANGLDLEEGLVSALEAAEEDGVAVFSATDHVELIPFEAEEAHAEDEHSEDAHAEDEHSEDAHAEDEHAEDEHSEEAHAEDEHGHEHGDEDPHIWLDPARMADVALALGEELAAVDPDAGFAERAGALADELDALDAEIRDMVATIPEEDRVLVTNHEVMGYFADAYGFEVVATIIPGGTTLAEPSAAELTDIIQAVVDTGAPAVFAETTGGSRLAEVIAEEAGTDVQVVQLHTESLSEPDGPAATYAEMMRTNAELVVGALAG